MQPLLTAFVAASVGGGVMTSAIISRLRSRHPQMWETLARPNPFIAFFWPRGVESRVRLWHFLWHGDYLVLGDPGLTFLARFYRLYFAGYLVLLLFVVARWIWLF